MLVYEQEPSIREVMSMTKELLADRISINSKETVPDLIDVEMKMKAVNSRL